MKTPNLELKGKIISILPNANYNVKITIEDREFFVLCYLCGKMTKHYINPCIGDTVMIEMSPLDFSNKEKMKGRVVKRLK